MILSRSCTVLVECHVEHPAQAVLDGPVGADVLCEALTEGCLSQNQLRLGVKGGDDMKRAPGRRPVEGAAQGLAVDGDDTPAIRTQSFQKAPKTEPPRESISTQPSLLFFNAFPLHSQHSKRDDLIKPIRVARRRQHDGEGMRQAATLIAKTAIRASILPRLAAFGKFGVIRLIRPTNRTRIKSGQAEER